MFSRSETREGERGRVRIRIELPDRSEIVSNEFEVDLRTAQR